MGHWTQFDEDKYRLPQGFSRIAYDADTQRYTFRDSSTGKTYQGAPGAEYGELTPVSFDFDSRMSDDSKHKNTRPDLSVNVALNPPVQSFSDFLPAELIASPSTAVSSQSSSPPPVQSRDSHADRLRKAVRTAALPKIQGIVLNALRKSRTGSKESVSDKQPKLD